MRTSVLGEQYRLTEQRERPIHRQAIGGAAAIRCDTILSSALEISTPATKICMAVSEMLRRLTNSWDYAQQPIEQLDKQAELDVRQQQR